MVKLAILTQYGQWKLWDKLSYKDAIIILASHSRAMGWTLKSTKFHTKSGFTGGENILPKSITDFMKEVY